MLKFEGEQKVCTIAGVEVGGQPGERPTVLIGSIFFSGHRIVSEPRRGSFDKDEARALLDREAEASARTGNPRLIDVSGDTGMALINYIEFVAAHSDAPILVKSVSRLARLETIRHFAGSDVAPRLVYNYIGEDHTEEELACIRECEVKSAVLTGFSTSALRPNSRVRLLKEKLLPAAERAGVENILVDAGALDTPSVSRTALAIREIKDTLGYPTGCATSNALYNWRKLRAQGCPVFEATAASVFALVQSQGADFVLYGPIGIAPCAFAAAATVDAMMAYTG